MTYFLADTTHEDYDALVEQQRDAFASLPWWEAHVYNMVVNIAWTQAFNDIITELPDSWVILNNNFDPSSRDMTEWEEPFIA